VPLVNPAKLAPLALQAVLVNPEKMALPVPLVALVTLVDPAVQVKQAAPAPPVTPVRTAHPAAANTAHRLVWLQVIKRRRLPSQAIRPFGRQLGRLFNYDQYHHFFQTFGLPLFPNC